MYNQPQTGRIPSFQATMKRLLVVHGLLGAICATDWQQMPLVRLSEPRILSDRLGVRAKT